MQTQEKRIIWAELAEERVRGVGRGDLTDGQWQRLEPLLMAHRARTGRPAKDHRTVINGILWVLRTGAPWRDLPEIYGPWRTAASRFYRWRKQGLWDRFLAAAQQEADAAGQIDWEVHYVDGTNVRAHQDAAGAKRGTETRRWGVPGEVSGPKSI